LRRRRNEREHWKAMVPNPANETQTPGQLRRSRVATRTSKRYAKNRLSSAQATFTAGDESPRKGGDAKGVGNGRPDTPAIKWGRALARNAPPKKYPTWTYQCMA